MPSRSRTGVLLFAALAVLAAGIALRVGFLGADPTYPFWSGWITDEGRWTELAREWVAFRAPDLDSPIGRTHLILGPVFQLFATVSFSVLGVGTVPARMVSVVFGLGILLLAGLFLRRRLGTPAALATVALLAVQPDLVYFSRVAIPEVGALFFELCTFALIVGGPRTVRRAGLAGLASALALGVKGTTAPVVPAFALMVLLVHRPDDPGGRWTRFGAYAAGILIPGLAAFLAYGLATGSVTALLSGVGGIRDILSFLTFDSPYSIAATLYEGGWTVRVNLILVVLWALVALALIRRPPHDEAWAVFVGALVWAGGWLAPWALLLYFPERYVAHIHLPLVIALGSGATILWRAGEAAGATAFRTAVEACTGPRRWLVAALLATPLAATLGPALVSGLAVAGLRLENLRFHLAILGLLGGLSVAVLLLHWRASSVLGAAAAPPLIALGWWIGRAFGLLPDGYWRVLEPEAALGWALLIAASAAGAVILVKRSGTPGRLLLTGLVIYGGGLGVGWAVGGFARLAARTYVVDEVQAFLHDRYGPDRIVGVIEGTSVFLDTPFRYRELMAGDPVPDVVLVYWRGDDERLHDEHRLVADFPLDMGPGYAYALPEGERIRVFERRGSGPLSPGSP